VRLPDDAHQLVLGDLLEVFDCVRTDPSQPFGGGRADTGDHGHLHRSQQVPLGSRRYDDQAVRLVELAGDLGDQLGAADADRATEPAGHSAHVVLHLAGDLGDRFDGEVVET